MLGVLVGADGDVSGGGKAEKREVMISFVCMMCDAKLQAKQTSAGKIIECPKCGCFAEVPDRQAADGKQKIAAVGSGGDTAETQAGKKVVKSTGKVNCPSCEQKLDDSATVCPQCGIYIKNGRPILTAWDVDANELEDKAERIVKTVSWLIPFGLYPVYSDAIGNHKPYATWGITAVTVLVSIWFLVLNIAGSPQMMSAKNLMLWGGKAKPKAEQIQMLYYFTSYGDAEAFAAKKEELSADVPEEELDMAALNALTPRQQCFGEYRHFQLLTHAFLHGGILHLAGNMLFLLVLGSRVNATIGNIATVILYPILAIIAALFHLASLGAEPPMPMLGASGAVMGLAGAYLLLFPIHKVYMVIWMRWGLLFGFHLSFKCFAVRGFWVVLFYIMFDVIAVSLTVKSGTAHWAHIGGLLGGITLAFVLLAARIAYSGSDMLSLVLGRYAWMIIGTPEARRK
jgi:membrane associated rhomboid family serine protease/predicted RNA-binding Zn-ribbon protein involved in translation (DUF1610 family)